MPIVYNVQGSNRDRPPGNNNSWADFWRSRKTVVVWPQLCQVVGCERPVAGGAHVSLQPNVRFVSTGGNVPLYIAPLCKFHNNPNSTNGIHVGNKRLCSRGKFGKKP